MDNTGLLDIYSVTWEGRAQLLKLYVNMYRGGKLEAPMGFTVAR